MDAWAEGCLEFILVLVLVACVAVLALKLLVVAPAQMRCEAACLQAGWAQNDYIWWQSECYCIREENEFEITKPLRVIIQEGE